MKLRYLNLEEEIYKVFEHIEIMILKADQIDGSDALQKQINIVNYTGKYMMTSREAFYRNSNYSREFIDEQFTKGRDYLVNHLIPRMEKKNH